MDLAKILGSALGQGLPVHFYREHLVYHSNKMTFLSMSSLLKVTILLFLSTCFLAQVSSCHQIAQFPAGPILAPPRSVSGLLSHHGSSTVITACSCCRGRSTQVLHLVPGKILLQLPHCSPAAAIFLNCVVQPPGRLCESWVTAPWLLPFGFFMHLSPPSVNPTKPNPKIDTKPKLMRFEGWHLMVL